MFRFGVFGCSIITRDTIESSLSRKTCGNESRFIALQIHLHLDCLEERGVPTDIIHMAPFPRPLLFYCRSLFLIPS
jgi:hypothetical protein